MHAITLIIQDDLKLTPAEALKVFEESQVYSKHAHDDDDHPCVDEAVQYWAKRNAARRETIKEELAEPIIPDIEDGEVVTTGGGDQWVVHGDVMELID